MFYMTVCSQFVATFGLNCCLEIDHSFVLAASSRNGALERAYIILQHTYLVLFIS